MSGKPLGAEIRLDATNMPRVVVSPQDRVADAIYDVVREAICANMTPQRFAQEAAEAWDYHLKQDAKAAHDVLVKGRTP